MLDYAGVTLSENGIFEDGTLDTRDGPEPEPDFICPNEYCGTFIKRMRAYLRAYNLFAFHYWFIFVPLLPLIQLLMPFVTIYGVVTFLVCQLSGGTLLCE